MPNNSTQRQKQKNRFPLKNSEALLSLSATFPWLSETLVSWLSGVPVLRWLSGAPVLRWLSGAEVKRFPLLLLLVLPYSLFAQQIQQDSASKKIEIIQSDRLSFEMLEGNAYKYLVGDVILKQDDATMYCDSAKMTGNNVEAFRDVVIQQDSASIYSNVLLYNGNSRKAVLIGDVLLDDSPNKLETDRLDYDLNTKMAQYNNGAILSNDRARLKSKRGYYYTKTKLAYFKEDVSVVDSNFTLTADTLKYDALNKIAHFLGPTHINVNGNKVYCEAGYYDTEKNKAIFEKNAWIEQDGQRAQGDKIIYDGKTDRAELLGKSIVNRDNQSIYSDNAFYDGETGNSIFTDNVQVIDGSRIIFSERLEYNSETGNGIAIDGVIVQDDPRTIYADTLDYNKKTGLATAIGSVYLIDTLRELSIECQRAVYEDSSAYILATGRPLMTTLVDGDSLYLAADTLRSFETADSLQAFSARKRVRLFKSDLQAVCGKLDYNEVDSIFRFREQPILWSDTSQFVADTINMQLKNQEIDHIDLLDNALIINSPDEIFFNQIKGKNINAFFRKNEIRIMKVRGNGEVIYYALDDSKAYMGVNEVSCGLMTVLFGNNTVETIKFYAAPNATMHPMAKVNHDNLRLDGFRWEAEQRPKGKWDLRYDF